VVTTVVYTGYLAANFEISRAIGFAPVALPKNDSGCGYEQDDETNNNTLFVLHDLLRRKN
jgi:hypothetical protein